jgi:hypothetical protein
VTGNLKQADEKVKDTFRGGVHAAGTSWMLCPDSQIARETISRRGWANLSGLDGEFSPACTVTRLDGLLDQLDLGMRLEAVSNPRTKDSRTVVVVVSR